jgi:hypothetical protein
MSPSLDRAAVRKKAEQRLLRLLSRARDHGLTRRLETLTLAQLEDSARPLLFSLLPRMLRRDGVPPESLQASFGYLDQGLHRIPATMVSSRRWARALATSRRLAAHRAARRRDP